MSRHFTRRNVSRILDRTLFTNQNSDSSLSNVANFRFRYQSLLWPRHPLTPSGFKKGGNVHWPKCFAWNVRRRRLCPTIRPRWKRLRRAATWCVRLARPAVLRWRSSRSRESILGRVWNKPTSFPYSFILPTYCPFQNEDLSVTLRAYSNHVPASRGLKVGN